MARQGYWKRRKRSKHHYSLSPPSPPPPPPRPLCVFPDRGGEREAEWPTHLVSLSQFCTIQVREMSAVYRYMYRQNEKSNIGSRVYEEEGTLIAFFEICALHLLSRLFFFYWRSTFFIFFFFRLFIWEIGNLSCACASTKREKKKHTTIFSCGKWLWGWGRVNWGWGNGLFPQERRAEEEQQYFHREQLPFQPNPEKPSLPFPSSSGQPNSPEEDESDYSTKCMNFTSENSRGPIHKMQERKKEREIRSATDFLVLELGSYVTLREKL